jgi:hypothetical protein
MGSGFENGFTYDRDIGKSAEENMLFVEMKEVMPILTLGVKRHRCEEELHHHSYGRNRIDYKRQELGEEKQVENITQNLRSIFTSLGRPPAYVQLWR